MFIYCKKVVLKWIKTDFQKLSILVSFEQVPNQSKTIETFVLGHSFNTWTGGSGWEGYAHPNYF